MSYLELLKLASPEAVIVITALVVLAIGGSRRAGAFPARNGPAVETVAAITAAIGIAVSVGVILILPQRATLFDGMLVISPLTSLFKIICLALAFFALLLTHSEKSLRNRGEFLTLLLFATVGLMLLVGSEELLMIFIGLELLGLSLYVLTAFDKTDLRSAEAGLKYFLFGSTASAFTLFGVSLVYGMAGTTALAEIAHKLTAAQPLLFAGIIMTLVGFAFKIAAAPFHLWAPDAYQAGPIPSAAFIASGSKVASFVVLGKIVLLGFGPLHGSAGWHAMTAGWTPVLAALAAFSILLGNLVALAQKNVRRLLAYSAVSHAGYTLLGLIAGSRDGFSATLFYTTIYAVTLLGAFGVCAIVRRETGGDDLADFSGIRSRSPLATACMSIFMLSLAGLPPLPGFFGKFYLFAAALRADGNQSLLWLVAIALFGSLISLYYYLIVLKVIFVGAASGQQPVRPSQEQAAVPRDPGLLQLLTVSALAAVVLYLGLMPRTLLTYIIASLN